MTSDTVQLRYVGDEAREVSMLPSGMTRRLEPDELFQVPAAYAESYECQPHLFVLNSEKPGPKAKA